MPRRWNLRPISDEAVQTAAARTGLAAPIARALALRVAPGADAMETFLYPRLDGLSDPGLLPDMHKAVARIWSAIKAGETITVFGDYDVDGVTATALLTRVLSELGADVKSFIPDRLDEGYGLSPDALERCLRKQKPGLIITVDCGTNSVKSVSHAQGLGVDVIVTDHHEPDRECADAYALINPKTARVAGGDAAACCSLEILSGAGVAFKLSHALLKAGRAAGHPAAERVDLRAYLDLAALGTVADIVPLCGENRILVRHGLKRLQSTQWAGMRALMAVAGIAGEPDTYHLGFQLGPRINAAGRIGKPMEALQLLLTDHADEARRIARLLNKTNSERRRIEKEMADEAFAEIDAYFEPQAHYGLVVARRGWHPGVVGIVASRIARHYNRPAIVLGVDEDGSMRGSCRSIEQFDILQGLHACSGHLVKYGGHRAAAGVTLAANALDAFRNAFNAAVSSELQPHDLQPVLNIDAVVSGDILTDDFLAQLRQLQPFGQDNPEPVWALYGIDVPTPPHTVGNNHLKFSVSSNSLTLDAIAFNYPRECLPEGPLDIAFTVKENRWNGRTRLQLHVRDIRQAAAE